MTRVGQMAQCAVVRKVVLSLVATTLGLFSLGALYSVSSINLDVVAGARYRANQAVVTASKVNRYLYVDYARPDDSGAGTSAATAKKTIQAALDIAAGGDQIRIRPGTYAITSSLLTKTAGSAASPIWLIRDPAYAGTTKPVIEHASPVADLTMVRVQHGGYKLQKLIFDKLGTSGGTSVFVGSSSRPVSDVALVDVEIRNGYGCNAGADGVTISGISSTNSVSNVTIMRSSESGAIAKISNNRAYSSLPEPQNAATCSDLEPCPNGQHCINDGLDNVSHCSTDFTCSDDGSDRSDAHGVKVVRFASRILVKGVELVDNSGDGLQCGPTATGDDPIDVIVEDCHIHTTTLRQGHTENAVDVKYCQHVSIFGTGPATSDSSGFPRQSFHGFRATGNLGSNVDRGAAVVVHFDAANVLVARNYIHDSCRGIHVGKDDSPVENTQIYHNLIDLDAAAPDYQYVAQQTSLSLGKCLADQNLSSRGRDNSGINLNSVEGSDVCNNTIRVNQEPPVGRFVGIKAGEYQDVSSSFSGRSSNVEIWNNLVISSGRAFDYDTFNTANSVGIDLAADHNHFAASVAGSAKARYHLHLYLMKPATSQDPDPSIATWRSDTNSIGYPQDASSQTGSPSFVTNTLYHLGSSSPAVDAGCCAGLPPLVQPVYGAEVDIGYVEMAP